MEYYSAVQRNGHWKDYAKGKKTTYCVISTMGNPTKTESKFMFAYGWKGGWTWEAQGVTAKKHKVPLWRDENALTWTGDGCITDYIKNHWTVYVKCVNCMVYESYLNSFYKLSKILKSNRWFRTWSSWIPIYHRTNILHEIIKWAQVLHSYVICLCLHTCQSFLLFRNKSDVIHAFLWRICMQCPIFLDTATHINPSPARSVVLPASREVYG